MAASAILCGRLVAQTTDLWVLRYVWDRAEQIEPLPAYRVRSVDRGAQAAAQASALRRRISVCSAQ